MRIPRAVLLLLGLLGWLPAVALAQEGPFQIESLKEAAPEEVAAPIREALSGEGYRVRDAAGKPVVDIWVRKSIPATGKPGAPANAIQYGVLAEGELLGVARYAQDLGDYRDQTVEAGVYTLRFGLQPVNGDHLGVSTYRDFALLLPAANDKDLKPIPAKSLEKQSAEAAGSNHPANLMLIAPPAGKGAGELVHDEAAELWGVVLPLGLAIPDEASPVVLPVQMIVVGVAPV
jgi:hypothetical protein